MSYDIFLADRVTKQVVELPFAHIMTGGTYQAEYDYATDTFSKKPITEAWLNVTWNYAPYYYEGSRSDDRFEGKGIRGIYGKTGLESIPMLNSLIDNIMSKYKDSDGDWITTVRDKTIYRDMFDNEVSLNIYIKSIINGTSAQYSIETGTEEVWEGYTNDYWSATAANAIKPLYQLIAMAKLRPDCIWLGD